MYDADPNCRYMGVCPLYLSMSKDYHVGIFCALSALENQPESGL